MQLPERDGIICDRCGNVYKDNFIYFSYDFRYVKCDGRLVPLNHILDSDVIFSCDICTDCNDNMAKIIVENNKKVTRNKILCELCGDYIVEDYYYCVIVQANVTIDGMPNVCVKCEESTFDFDKPCSKCGSVSFTRVAKVDVEDRYLEFSLCSGKYNELVKSTELVRKSAGKWMK